jgi:hypothetical protein
MSLDYVKFTPGFEQFMPKEYRDMVEHGPFGKKTTVSQMGSFKEILEEHPMCAGCAMTLFIRLAIIAFPNPEDTITVGTAGCGRLAISQAAIPFVYGNYGDQNGVASGLSRGLRLRFGDKPKDVVVIAGDGGTADIGLVSEGTVYHDHVGQRSLWQHRRPGKRNDDARRSAEDGAARKEVREDGHGHHGQGGRLLLYCDGCAE